MGCVINFVSNRIEYDGTSKKMSPKIRGVLEYMIKNQGQVLSGGQIFDEVWDYLDEDIDDQKAVRQTISRIKKEYPILEGCITNDQGIGYRLVLPKEYRVIFNADEASSTEMVPSGAQPAEPVAALGNMVLPKVLTRTTVPYADETTVIHRSSDLEKLKELLAKKKAAVMISGFGGLGKTTVARMLCAEMTDVFDCIGWVEYHGTLKDSLLASMSLYQEIDDREVRWNALYDRLKNDPTKKLLFVDNVDSDKTHGQDPQNDALLGELSGWPNLSVVLTSRFDQLRGYRSYRLKMLEPEACEDLFFYYYNEAEYEIPAEEREQRDVVKALVELAGYHTYAVELLAKSAKYTPSLEEYLNEVKKAGFRFPKLNVQTDHRNAYANAAEQLKKLFDLGTRSTSEMQVLWDFSVLPNLELSLKEVEQWLGYTVNDLDQLIREGWLLFRQGFSMHPLVKETMHLDLVNGKAPKGTMRFLLSKIICGEFLPEDEIDSFVEAKRKLDVAEHTLKYVTMTAEDLVPEEDLLELSRWAVAECWNEIGYFMSYSNTGATEARKYLEKALDHRRQMRNHLRYRIEYATSCDRLGYLLSDQETGKEEAERLLSEALSIRMELEKEEPGKYIADVAWTLDNLGYLLSLMEHRREEAEVKLTKAFKIRQQLERIDPEKHRSEVSWTCNNLGLLLQSEETREKEAEDYYRQALARGMDWRECKHSWEAVDSAIIRGNLAALLQRNPMRWEEAENLYRESLMIMKTVEQQQQGMYSADVLISYHNLMVFLERIPDAEIEIQSLKFEMMQIFEELEQKYPGVYRELFQELLKEEATFYIQSGSRKQKVPAFVLQQTLTQ